MAPTQKKWLLFLAFVLISSIIIKAQGPIHKKITINGIKPSVLLSYKIEKGDTINIDAKGKIRVGFLAGSRTPDGYKTYNNNIYNVFKDAPHCALMFCIVKDIDNFNYSAQKWFICGSSCQIIAPHSGNLVFDINETPDWRWDNSPINGGFQVAVLINTAKEYLGELKGNPLYRKEDIVYYKDAQFLPNRVQAEKQWQIIIGNEEIGLCIDKAPYVFELVEEFQGKIYINRIADLAIYQDSKPFEKKADGYWRIEKEGKELGICSEEAPYFFELIGQLPNKEATYPVYLDLEKELAVFELDMPPFPISSDDGYWHLKKANQELGICTKQEPFIFEKVGDLPINKSSLLKRLLGSKQGGPPKGVYFNKEKGIVEYEGTPYVKSVDKNWYLYGETERAGVFVDSKEEPRLFDFIGSIDKENESLETVVFKNEAVVFFRNKRFDPRDDGRWYLTNEGVEGRAGYKYVGIVFEEAPFLRETIEVPNKNKDWKCPEPDEVSIQMVLKHLNRNQFNREAKGKLTYLCSKFVAGNFGSWTQDCEKNAILDKLEYRFFKDENGCVWALLLACESVFHKYKGIPSLKFTRVIPGSQNKEIKESYESIRVSKGRNKNVIGGRNIMNVREGSSINFAHSIFGTGSITTYCNHFREDMVLHGIELEKGGTIKNQWDEYAVFPEQNGMQQIYEKSFINAIDLNSELVENVRGCPQGSFFSW